MKPPAPSTRSSRVSTSKRVANGVVHRASFFPSPTSAWRADDSVRTERRREYHASQEGKQGGEVRSGTATSEIDSLFVRRREQKYAQILI